ncbi:MAG: gp436 family protein [Lysobacterales bacterium]
MPYATAADLVIAFGARELAQLATPRRFDVVGDEDLELAIEDDTYPTGKPNEQALEACLDAINQALAVTDGMIDSYVGTHYTLPLASTPAVLREAALDLARYELQKEAATEEAQKRRDQVVAWLKDISGGKARLGVATIDSPAGSGGGIAIQPSAGRTFTADTMAAFTP